MCTAVTFQTKDFYFGRTLDYERSYGEEIVITPRNYVFHFREMGAVKKHYAMIGTAHVEDNYPLYYDAVNEKGLGMAGLNFVGNAHYEDRMPGKDNVASFEFIPWILAQCASVQEARKLLERVNLVNLSFNELLPPAQLHWIIADKKGALTVETRGKEVMVYDNPVGALTNNPPFDEQMFQLNNYMNLSPREPKNNFCSKLPLHTYSRGMGALGLPGDLSSQSRFVRVAFTKMNARPGVSELENVNQFFHILGSVFQTRGCCELKDGSYEATIYTSCCNADKGIYYYTAYDNPGITGIDMRRENLDAASLIVYPLVLSGQIRMLN